MKLNIAVIDDQSDDRYTVTTMLEQYFSKNNRFASLVKEYQSGKEFLIDYKKGSFQILFIDICMDEMDGLELSSRLRHTDKDIVIIFISTTTEFVFQTFKAVPHGYLYTYPFDSTSYFWIFSKSFIQELHDFGNIFRVFAGIDSVIIIIVGNKSTVC